MCMHSKLNESIEEENKSDTLSSTFTTTSTYISLLSSLSIHSFTEKEIQVQISRGSSGEVVRSEGMRGGAGTVSSFVLSLSSPEVGAR